VVLDAATQLLIENIAIDELRHVLYKLVMRFKTLDITSLLTLEAPFLFSTERVTEHGLSPIADNLLMLRYQETDAGLTTALTIVKTRGSGHDRGTHTVTVGPDGLGMRVGPSASEPPKRRPEDGKSG
jgi:circadian clock protein KaiC